MQIILILVVHRNLQRIEQKCELFCPMVRQSFFSDLRVFSFSRRREMFIVLLFPPSQRSHGFFPVAVYLHM